MARKLEDWLKSYMQYTQYSEAPDVFHFWTGISTIAGALRRRVRFDQLYWSWTPNFYIIFVAPSGVATKSTAMNVGMDMLTEIPGISLGPEVLTWQALIQSLAEAAEGYGDPFSEQGVEQMSCLTFASSELGTLLDPHDKRMLDILTDLWDNKDKKFEKATRTQGKDIAYKPWVNIIACTTPAWIAENMSRITIAGGFASRCIFVFADAKRRLVAYPRREKRDDLTALKADLLGDLTEIATLNGDFEMDDEAYAIGEEWYTQINTEHNAVLSSGGFDGFLSRKQGHVHKLAMVIAASRSNDKVITRRILEDSIAILKGIEADMPKALKNVGMTDASEKAQYLVSIVRQYKSITQTALLRIMFTRYGVTSEDCGKLLGTASASGMIATTQKDGSIFITPRD